MDIPENFFGMGGEEDITIQTVTWPNVELPLPRNITEGEALGNVIITVKPIFQGSPTAPEPEEPFTLAPDVEDTTIPEAENGTEEATRPWAFPEASTPGLGPATAFTSEDLVVQVTIAPGAAEVPGQPRLPGGKCPLRRGLHGARGRWRELGPGACTLNLTWDLRQASLLSNLAFLVCKIKGIGQTSDVFCHKSSHRWKRAYIYQTGQGCHKGLGEVKRRTGLFCPAPASPRQVPPQNRPIGNCHPG